MLAGGEAEGSWLLPDVLVNVSRGGDEVSNAVVKEVLLVCGLHRLRAHVNLCFPNVFHLLCSANVSENLNLQDGSCRVSLGPLGEGDELIVTANELEVVRPKKNEKLKIMNGSLRGATGKLIGLDGSDGIVKVEGSLDVKIVDMAILGKLAA
jgi:transcription elongation factor SPT5